MKKNYIALIAIVCALIGQAFKNEKRIGCEELLYWFKVINPIACEEVSLTDLNIPPVKDLNNNNYPDELNASYLRYASNNPFGCTDGDYACAVGFRGSQLQKDAVTHYWEPINASTYICCVRQP